MTVFSSPSGQLVLPSPQLGNRETLNLRSVYKRMMDGSIRGYLLGPAITSLEMEFANVNRPKIVELINFLRTNAGQIVQCQDYRQVNWTGKILTTPFEAEHAAVRNNTFKLVFEGSVNA